MESFGSWHGFQGLLLQIAALHKTFNINPLSGSPPGKPFDSGFSPSLEPDAVIPAILSWPLTVPALRMASAPLPKMRVT